MKNIKIYKSLFGSNFLPIDNSKTLSYMESMRKFSTLVRKGIGMFMKKPIKNKIKKIGSRNKGYYKQKVLRKKLHDTKKFIYYLNVFRLSIHSIRVGKVLWS